MTQDLPPATYVPRHEAVYRAVHEGVTAAGLDGADDIARSADIVFTAEYSGTLSLDEMERVREVVATWAKAEDVRRLRAHRQKIGVTGYYYEAKILLDLALKTTKNAFLAEIIAVCKRHGLVLTHEDGHGSFRVKDYDEGSAASLAYAADQRSNAKEKR